MKILYFADLHGHNYKEFSFLDKTGVNSRLRDCQEVLLRICESAREHKVDRIRFLGDWLHLKNNHDSQVIQLLIGAMEDMAKDCPIEIVPGNHDYRMWGEQPVLLELLDDYCEHGIELYHQSGWYGDVYVEPFTRKVKELNQRIAELEHDASGVFLGHQDIKGVQYGGFRVEKGLDADALSGKFAWSFVGHYHAPKQIRKNVISIGAPLQHCFSDAGGERGWWIHNEQSGELQFIENIFSPKFWDLQYGDNSQAKLSGDLEKDFYRVTVEGTKLPNEVKEIRWKRVSYKLPEMKKGRSAIRFSDSKEDAIAKYVELKAGDLDKEKLIEIGRKYL